MNKKIKSFICLAFVVIFVFSVCAGAISFLLRPSSSASAQTVQTSAKAMCVMEADSKRVLYSKNSDDRLAMASTTKILTAITAIENCDDLDKPFEVSPKSIGVKGTSIYLRKGEVLSTRQLLYGLMLVSGNDASVAIGEHVGGSTKNFVDMMNETAKKIGAYDTHFDNTHGLDSKTHFTTAYDLALISSYALNNPTFREIVSTKNIKITSEAGKNRYLRNKNKLLFSMEGCCGVKTGFTNDAGRCLVSACERDGMKVVCVVLNCGPMFEESKALIEQAYNEYKLVDLAKGFSIPNSVKVEEGRSEEVKIQANGSYFYPLREGEEKRVRYEMELPSSLEAPVNKGEEIGEVKIFIDNDLHFTEKIYTIESVRRKSIFAKIKQLIDKW